VKIILLKKFDIEKLFVVLENYYNLILISDTKIITFSYFILMLIVFNLFISFNPRLKINWVQMYCYFSYCLT